MSVAPIDSTAAARLALVREHVSYENSHDLNAIMGTFGEAARYEDEPAGERHDGRAAVETYYATLLQSVPDLFIDVQREHVTGDGVVLEVIIRGTHTGAARTTGNGSDHSNSALRDLHVRCE